MTFLDGSKRKFSQVTGANVGGLLTAVIDRNGNPTNVAYGGNGLISTVTDAAGDVLTFNYGTGVKDTLVASVSDAVGTFTTYQYDTSQRLMVVTYPDTSTLNFFFDGSNNITSVKDKNSKVIEAHGYDTQFPRRGTSSSRAAISGINQEAVTVTYPSSTQTTVTDSQTHVTNYAYQLLGQQQYVNNINGSGCSTCGGRGNSSFSYDAATANRTSSTDANSNITSSTYDASGNVLTRSVTVNGSPVTWTYTYSGLGEVLTAQDPLGNTTTNTYDGSGNLLTTKTPPPAMGQQ